MGNILQELYFVNSCFGFGPYSRGYKYCRPIITFAVVCGCLRISKVELAYNKHIGTCTFITTLSVRENAMYVILSRYESSLTMIHSDVREISYTHIGYDVSCVFFYTLQSRLLRGDR